MEPSRFLIESLGLYMGIDEFIPECRWMGLVLQVDVCVNACLSLTISYSFGWSAMGMRI